MIFKKITIKTYIQKIFLSDLFYILLKFLHTKKYELNLIFYIKKDSFQLSFQKLAWQLFLLSFFIFCIMNYRICLYFPTFCENDKIL